MTELGTKRSCPECQGKFYDMGALEVSCPKCDFVFPIHLISREEPLPAIKKVAVKRFAPKDLDTIEGMDKVVELEDFDDPYDDVDHLEEVEEHLEIPESDKNGDDADDEMFIDEISDGDLHIIDDLDDEADSREAL